MKLEKPKIEFIEIEPTDVVTTSGCPDGVNLTSGSGTICKNDSATANKVCDDSAVSGMNPIN